MRNYDSNAPRVSRMSVNLELKPETEDQLAERARQRGMSVEDYIRDLLEVHAANGKSTFETTTDEEWEAALEAFAHSPVFQNISWPIDDSRESIYREREDAQL
jgi:hypothetical protein